MTSEPRTTDIEDAVNEAIEAASNYVSLLPAGQKAWGEKEYNIADTAAREAIAAIRQKEAGK